MLLPAFQDSNLLDPLFLLLTPSIALSLQIKDAFGLPLQASSNAWWSVDLDAAFVGPSVRQVCCRSCLDWIR
jgi:hypothetical protein